MNRRERRLAAKQAKSGKAVAPSPVAVSAFNQGVTLQQQGRLPEAAQAFFQASQHMPQFFEAHQALAQVSFQAGQFDQAVQSFEKALELRPEAADCQTGLAQILRRAQPQGYQPALEKRLLMLFASSAVKHQDLALVAASTLKQKHASLMAAQDADLSKLKPLMDDRLLLEVLSKTVLVDRELEILLTSLRKTCLTTDDPTTVLPPSFLLALAWQAGNNAGAWFQSDEEIETLAQLEAPLASDLEKRRKGDARLEKTLLLLAAYQPLDQLSCGEQLLKLRPEGWSREAQPFFKRALMDRAKEQKAAASIDPYLSRETSPDGVSQAVQEMYEENPYPRWLHLDQLPSLPLGSFLAHRLPGFDATDRFNQPGKLLVAGCGTGRQVVTLGLCHRNLEITAFDLSRASLGYAQMMAKRYDADNCRFYQGNILDLNEDDRQYDAIVCTGVLHHMADPLAGWKALVSRLCDGGIMQIALYSSLARRDITKARSRIAELELSDDASGIRTFRQRLLLEQEEPGLNALADQADFADLNGCRDLLFHRQERCYQIPEIAEALSDLGLEFLGFDFVEPDIPQAFKAAFPAEGSERDLSSWARFEADNPDSFIAMYNFWCRKT
ncbi:methyltransferase [Rhodovibrionaceae bacterium A322]